MDAAKARKGHLKRIIEEVDDDDDELLIQEYLLEQPTKKWYRGSVPGRRPANSKDRLIGGDRLFDDYFSSEPRFSEKAFRRRFRMSKVMFLRIKDKLEEQVGYFKQKPDACGVLGASVYQKMTAALRQLAYGSPADILQEYIRTSGTLNAEALNKFCESVVALFGDEYLCPLDGANLQYILDQNAARGFPGCIGSLDCMHWLWKNCPAAYHGQHTGKGKKPSIVLEAIATFDLRIWHFSFGEPGANNDINILDSSHVMDQFLILGDKHTYVLNKTERNLLYLLADGIYPNWPVFVKSYKTPVTSAEKKFTRVQEVCRKDVERAFGVLQDKWRIFRYPSLFWYTTCTLLLSAV
jgi:hypothetical protein